MSWFAELLLDRTSWLVFAVFLFTLHYMMKKKYNHPPGPFAWPLVGNLLALVWQRKSPTTYHYLAHWSKQYGPIMTVHFGYIRSVFLSDYETTKEAFVDKKDEFSWRPDFYSAQLMEDAFGSLIVFGQPTDKWKLHRKTALTAIRKYASCASLDKCVHKAVEKFNAHVDQNHLGRPVEPVPLIELLVMNMTSGVVFGKCYDADDPEIKSMIKFMNDFLHTNIGVPGDFVPILKYFPKDSSTKKFLKVVTSFFDFFGQRFNETAVAFDPDHPNNFTDHMLETQKEAVDSEDTETAQYLTNNHLKAVIIEMAGAGIETSTYTLLWVFYLMALFPEIQEKMQKQIDEVLDDGRIPTIDDKKRLPYCHAVLHEVLRFAPPAPLGVPHTVPTDTKLREYDIPKGTMVWLNMWAINHDPVYWKNPDSFNPDRFLDEAGNVLHNLPSFVTFSAGRRKCIGEHLVNSNMPLLLACLFQRYKVDFVERASTPGVDPLCNRDVVYADKPLQCIPENYKIKFKKRK